MTSESLTSGGRPDMQDGPRLTALNHSGPSSVGPEPREEDISRFVENFGVAMDGAGMPRAVGRMLGWLLICDPAEQSPSQLMQALQSSAGGVSQNLRMLMQYKFIERVGKGGDRRSYYRVAPNAWETVMNAQRADVARFLALTREGLDLLGGSDPSRSRRLAEANDFYGFLTAEMPRMIERYHAQKSSPDE